MIQKFDDTLERLTLEARMLWAFVQGHILMMSVPATIWFRAINERSDFQEIDYSPVLICGLIGLTAAVTFWMAFRFRFPYASARFINMTRMSFHFLLMEVAVIAFFLPQLMIPDRPGYISNKEVFFALGLFVAAILPLVLRHAIFSTTRVYLELLERV